MSIITNKEELRKKVHDDFWNDSAEFCAAYFDFDVSMPIADILEVYADLQADLNGDDVTYPGNVEGEYAGNCMDFLLSCNGKPGYTRMDYDESIDFAF